MSRQIFVATNIILSQQTRIFATKHVFCRAKIMQVLFLVAPKVYTNIFLSRQNQTHACRDKHMFVTTKMILVAAPAIDSVYSSWPHYSGRFPGRRDVRTVTHIPSISHPVFTLLGPTTVDGFQDDVTSLFSVESNSRQHERRTGVLGGLSGGAEGGGGPESEGRTHPAEAVSGRAAGVGKAGQQRPHLAAHRHGQDLHRAEIRRGGWSGGGGGGGESARI